MNTQDLVNIAQRTTSVSFRPVAEGQKIARIFGIGGDGVADLPLALHRIEGDGAGGDVERTAAAFRLKVERLITAAGHPYDRHTIVAFEARALPITTSPAEQDPSNPVPYSWSANVMLGIMRDVDGATAEAAARENGAPAS